MKEGKRAGVLRSEVHLRPGQTDEERFSRADLVFTGVDHSAESYEVRVFLNNPEADDKTPRTPGAGYAGRFVIFGHGGCFGDTGHCDVPAGPRAAHDLRPQHPLTPQRKIVTVTKALSRVLENDDEGLKWVTLVPVSKGAEKRKRKLSADLFKFDSMELRTYAGATASELGLSLEYEPEAVLSGND